jgi:DnaA-homolog protein
MAQLPLALPLAPHARFETFVPGPNAAAVRHLVALASGAAEETLWLWGARGSGKTHLLQAACRAAASAGQRSMYITLELASDPEILAGVESIDVLALDEIQQVARAAQWEAALFGVLDAFLARRGGLLIAALQPPTAVGFELADLASRAAGAVVYRIETLGGADQVAALIAHARARGMELDSAAAEYLLSRVVRDMSALVRWLERLDHASLVAQRKPTIPLIRELLAADLLSPER